MLRKASCQLSGTGAAQGRHSSGTDALMHCSIAAGLPAYPARQLSASFTSRDWRAFSRVPPRMCSITTMSRCPCVAELAWGRVQQQLVGGPSAQRKECFLRHQVPRRHGTASVRPRASHSDPQKRPCTQIVHKSKIVAGSKYLHSHAQQRHDALMGAGAQQRHLVPHPLGVQPRLQLKNLQQGGKAKWAGRCTASPEGSGRQL